MPLYPRLQKIALHINERSLSAEFLPILEIRRLCVRGFVMASCIMPIKRAAQYLNINEKMDYRLAAG